MTEKSFKDQWELIFTFRHYKKKIVFLLNYGRDFNISDYGCCDTKIPFISVIHDKRSLNSPLKLGWLHRFKLCLVLNLATARVALVVRSNQYGGRRL